MSPTSREGWPRKNANAYAYIDGEQFNHNASTPGLQYDHRHFSICHLISYYEHFQLTLNQAQFTTTTAAAAQNTKATNIIQSTSSQCIQMKCTRYSCYCQADANKMNIRKRTLCEWNRKEYIIRYCRSLALAC